MNFQRMSTSPWSHVHMSRCPIVCKKGLERIREGEERTMKSEKGSIDKLSCRNICPRSFFDQYIARRIPCHFEDYFQEKREDNSDSNGDDDEKNIKNIFSADKWTNAYLKQHCSDEVKVEFRNSVDEKFGQGNEIQMPFAKFVEEIESGSELYYMTTQKLEYSPEGQARILSPPMRNLAKDFPINPSLMGNLIVQNINLWMGASTKRVTSGLHHDYHDNLYVVLRGTKEITLLPPEEYPNMYTVGNVVKLHPNGRINYAGQLTRADGSCEESVRALEASMKLEKAVLSMGSNSDNEEEVEGALQDLLDAQIACNEEYSEEEDEDEEFEDSVDNEIDDGLPIDLKIPTHVLNCKKRPNENDCNENPIEKRHRELKDSNEKEETLSKDQAPPNFSKVDTALDESEIKRIFPKFLSALEKKKSVILRPGEMLYLPAGWFHEVHSSGSPPQGHVAMNYWFHPPDTNNFSSPYSSDFWKKDWIMRMASNEM